MPVACICHVAHCTVARATLEKTGVVAAFRLCSSLEKGECPVQRHIVQHNDVDMVKREKGTAVSLYLNELLIKYVNSKVDRSAFSHNGFPPVGPWHLVGATMDNTLD